MLTRLSKKPKPTPTPSPTVLPTDFGAGFGDFDPSTFGDFEHAGDAYPGADEAGAEAGDAEADAGAEAGAEAESVKAQAGKDAEGAGTSDHDEL